MARLGANARTVYESCYTETRMLQSYRQLYFDLLRAKCPAAGNYGCTGNDWRAGRISRRVESKLFRAGLRTPPAERWRPMTRTYPTNQHQPKSGGHSGVVRQATAQDLAGIVNIHQKSFKHFFLTRLGGDFLWNYYGLVLQYRAGIMLVGEGPGVLEGFACGFVDPAEFYQLMWRFKRIFALPVLFRAGSSPFSRH